MINFIEGKINLGERNICTTSNYEELNSLVEEGLVEKREGNGRRTYYVEAVEDGMRFGVFIRLQEKNRVELILLRWLDRPTKGWDDASEKALKDEYRVLSNFVAKMVGTQHDCKKNRQRIWRFKWGQLEVSYEPRSFDAAIFIVLR